MDLFKNNSSFGTYRKSNSMNDLTTSSIFENTKPSIPYNSIEENTCILTKKIKILTENLQLANNEIEDLNIENQRLKTELEICQKMIHMYKNSGYTENPQSINLSTRKRKKPKLHRPITGKVEVSVHENAPTLPDGLINCNKEIKENTLPPIHSTMTKNSLTIDPIVTVTHVGQMSDTENSDTPSDSTYSSNNINVNRRRRKTQQNHSPELVDKKNGDEEPLNSSKCPKKNSSQSSVTVKRRLCILSNISQSGSLQTLENTFSDQFQYCRYSYPNAKINQLLCNITYKTSNFNMNDYCVILLGETDLKNNCNFIELINLIRESIQGIKHTNIIICVPTYIQGALMHNYKVEMFNNLLYIDLQNNKYAHLFDSNAYLSKTMFSSLTGRINNSGLRHLYSKLIENLNIDIKQFPLTNSNDIDISIPNNTTINFVCNKAIGSSSESNRNPSNHLFRV